MRPEAANAVYDILVKECSATEFMRDSFIHYHVHNPDRITEWRFQGKLGFGGKFWVRRNGWDINCYYEDKTSERKVLIDRVNQMLAEIRAQYT